MGKQRRKSQSITAKLKRRGWVAQISVRGTNVQCRLYRAWARMHHRCRATSGHWYEAYGRRGIRVCPQWSTYGTFRIWAISNGFRKGLSLDRIDNDGNYGPTNCRWATATTQARNRRSNVVTAALVNNIRSSEESASEIEHRLGVPRHTVWDIRLGRSWRNV